jgi:hypothetical protein
MDYNDQVKVKGNNSVNTIEDHIYFLCAGIKSHCQLTLL